MTALREDMLEKYIPYYLTQPAKDALKTALREFRDSHTFKDFYITKPPEHLLQGDCFRDMPVFNPATGKQKRVAGITITNTCDMDSSNTRSLPVLSVFCPIMKMSSLQDLYRHQKLTEERIQDICASIRRQEVSHMFFMPHSPEFNDECVARLDNVFSVPTKTLLDCERAFSLGQTGFYFLLFKLSVHFCRFHENFDRYPSP